jgi:hypothetical protein
MTGLIVVSVAVLATLEVVHIRGTIDQQQGLARLSERIEQVRAAMALLTDTAETGFRDVALEVGRAAAVAEIPKGRAQVARRLSGAALRGRSVRDIAAAEQMSEGEVRLRMTLADAPAGRKTRRAPLQ